MRTLLRSIVTTFMKKKIVRANSGAAPNAHATQLKAADLFKQALRLQQQGHLENAKLAYETCLRVSPNYAPAYLNLGMICRSLGHPQAAIDHYNTAIHLHPGFAEAYLYRGVALNELKESQAALLNYRRAIELNPNLVEAHFNQGNVHRALGNNLAAAQSYRRTIQLEPGLADAHTNLGNALVELRKFDDALVSFNLAAQLKPDDAVIYFNRASCQLGLGDINASRADLDHAIRIDPQHAESYAKRAAVLTQLKLDKEALADLVTAYGLNPNIDYVLGDLIHKSYLACDWSNHKIYAEKLEEKVLDHKKIVHPWNYLSISDNISNQRFAAENYAEKEIKKLIDFGKTEIIFSKKTLRSSRKIKIGYYSSNFHDHAVMHLMRGVFEKHDRSKFELIAFSLDKNIKDVYQKNILDFFDKFYQVHAFDDSDIVDLSSDLKIDIAVDLLGYTGDCKPGIFFNRCAPVQINFLGYAGTLGNKNWDYIISDKIVTPSTFFEYYSEKIIQLPHCFQPNDVSKAISENTLEKKDFQLPANGFIFCCSNNSYKITPQVFEIWMRLLIQVPGSVLWLFSENAEVIRNLKREAMQRDVDADRLIFGKKLPSLADHLARYKLADLFLDTFPYNAHTTASDALWAGLPVLTCVGQSFASRVAASLLTAIDLPELITSNHADYETVALRLANNPAEMTLIKQKLAANRLTSPLFDTEKFTRHLESAYQKVFDRHCADLPPDHIEICTNS